MYSVIPVGQELQRKMRTEIMSSIDAVVSDVPRISTGWATLDEVFGGGGIAVGSTSLVWGEGGIGKTTLLLQLAASVPIERSLVVQTEQSLQTTASTLARIGARRRGLDLAATDDLSEVRRVIERGRYEFVIVDSLQMLVDEETDSAAGSIKQGRRVGRALVRLAQLHKITMIISNHVLSSGRQAGGTFNVHGVDATFEYTGDLRAKDGVRWVQCLKNRNGPSGGKARLRMGAKGLEEFPETTPGTKEKAPTIPETAPATAAPLARRPARHY